MLVCALPLLYKQKLQTIHCLDKNDGIRIRITKLTRIKANLKKLKHYITSFARTTGDHDFHFSSDRKAQKYESAMKQHKDLKIDELQEQSHLLPKSLEFQAKSGIFAFIPDYEPHTPGTPDVYFQFSGMESRIPEPEFFPDMVHLCVWFLKVKFDISATNWCFDTSAWIGKTWLSESTSELASLVSVWARKISLRA